MNFIEKLNSIKVTDLMSLAKDISPGQLKDSFSTKPHMLINTVLVIAAIIFAGKVFIQHLAQVSDFKKQRIQQEEKLSAVKEMENVEAEYNEALKKFPETIEGNKLINYISELALKHKIQMQSFSPGQMEENDYWSVTKVNINVVSADYTDIILFIKDLEESGYFIRIAHWSGKLQAGTARDPRKEEKQQIASLLEIESVKLK